LARETLNAVEASLVQCAVTGVPEAAPVVEFVLARGDATVRNVVARAMLARLSLRSDSTGDTLLAISHLTHAAENDPELVEGALRVGIHFLLQHSGVSEMPDVAELEDMIGRLAAPRIDSVSPGTTRLLLTVSSSLPEETRRRLYARARRTPSLARRMDPMLFLANDSSTSLAPSRQRIGQATASIRALQVASSSGRALDRLALEGYLKNPHHRVRFELAKSLGSASFDDAEPLLLGLLRDPSRIVRRAALNSLHASGGTRAVARVIQCLRDPALLVRIEACDLLIGARHPYLEEALLELQDHWSAKLRTRALHTLWWFDRDLARARLSDFKVAPRYLRKQIRSYCLHHGHMAPEALELELPDPPEDEARELVASSPPTASSDDDSAIDSTDEWFEAADFESGDPRSNRGEPLMPSARPQADLDGFYDYEGADDERADFADDSDDIPF
jgi:hypothetical protein